MIARLLGLVVFCALLWGLVGCGGNVNSSNTLLNTPVITGISPDPATRGSMVQITGQNFSGSMTTAYFTPTTVVGNATASAANSGGSTGVAVTVPNSIAAGIYNVAVVTSNGSGTFSQTSNAVTITVN